MPNNGKKWLNPQIGALDPRTTPTYAQREDPFSSSDLMYKFFDTLVNPSNWGSGGMSAGFIGKPENVSQFVPRNPNIRLKDLTPGTPEYEELYKLIYEKFMGTKSPAKVLSFLKPGEK